MSERIPSQWEKMIEADPNHSQWFIDRFRAMAERGEDLAGEARLIDAMAPRGARILDAGCGSGRTSGYLHQMGHTVVGVDVDAALIAAAEEDHAGPIYLVDDLAQLDLPARGVSEGFDLIVSAGNVMTFLATETRVAVLDGFARHVKPDGRVVVGFGAGRGYEFDQFLSDALAVRLAPQVLLAGWDLQPFREDADFLVAVLGPEAWTTVSTESQGRVPPN